MRRQSSSGMGIVWLGILATVLLRAVPTCPAAKCIWTQKAGMITPRWKLGTCEVDGKIYAIGGVPTEGTGSKLSVVEAYDPLTNAWAGRADIPTPRTSFALSSVGGKLYAVGGGGDGDSITEEYDPATDTWTRKADMPTARRFLTGCSWDGKVYAIGGTPVGVWLGMKTVEAYDPATDTWTAKADMPFGVWGLCAHVVNGKIYTLGGRPGLVSQPYVYEYDPATDTWTQKADMPVATSNMASAVLGDKIVIVGGWVHSNAYPYTAVQVYEPTTDTWATEGDAPFLRAGVSASVVDSRVYVIGGTDRPHPCPATSTVYELAVYGPPPDFNADGVVDIQDLLRVIRSWGRDDLLADAAPALGDGVVDVLDLEFLMGYWGQEIDDPTLIAHWALDETEGMVAYDSAGVNDGAITGVPAWQIDGGQVNGALEFDGATLVTAAAALSPSDGPFSVLAWVKGGAAGQVVLSQVGGANWLGVDPIAGTLMTELTAPGRSGKPLVSSAMIADGDWHRVGFAWDGSTRRLYVDDVLAAEDAQDELASGFGGLNLGCGEDMAPGTYWTGLIDDVRIYNRVVKP